MLNYVVLKRRLWVNKKFYFLKMLQAFLYQELGFFDTPQNANYWKVNFSLF